MEAVREPEVIRLYREDEVVELVAKYLLANKKQEQEKQHKQRVRQIVNRQRKRQLLMELLISFLKQIMLIVFVALFPWVICKVTGDPEYYNMYYGCADCARNDLSVNQGELEVIRQNEKITLCISGRIDSWNLDVS